MLKIAGSGLISIMAVIAAYAGYGFYSARGSQSPADVAAKLEEPLKTDYITIEFFDGGRVSGYLSFRAIVGLKDPADIAVASYNISDIAHRSLPKLKQLVPIPLTQVASERLQGFLLPALKARMGPTAIGELTVVDVAFDQRVVEVSD